MNRVKNLGVVASLWDDFAFFGVLFLPVVTRTEWEFIGLSRDGDEKFAFQKSGCFQAAIKQTS